MAVAQVQSTASEDQVRAAIEQVLVAQGGATVENQPGVLAHRRDWQGKGVLALHNFAAEGVQVGVEMGDIETGGPMAELLGDQRYGPAKTGQPLALDGFGYRWLRLPG